MKDGMRKWGIVIWRDKTGDNLEATSESGGPQIHCDLKDVKWANVIGAFSRMHRDPADKLDSIEGLLQKNDKCVIRVECKLSDLEAIGFRYQSPS